MQLSMTTDNLISLENHDYSGEFGIVYKGYIVQDSGQITTAIVAIKTLKGSYITIAIDIIFHSYYNDIIFCPV